MLQSLYAKLTLAFVLVAFITAGLVALFIRLTSANRLAQLLIDQQRTNLVQTLGEFYTANGSWEGVAEKWRLVQSQAQLPFQVQVENFPGQKPPPDVFVRANLLGLADSQGVVIVAVDPEHPPGAVLTRRDIRAGTPVTVAGEQVGTIITARRPAFSREEAMYLWRTSQALLLAMLGALVVALILGVWLARTLTRPLKALTQAAQSISQGQLEQQVKVNSDDEIGQLAQAFNFMSREVARVNAQRRQMTADIAHDLRTPLTVISGYIEAMRDDVLEPTPERLSLIYAEIERLQNLVGDLRMLSLADAGELPLNPQWISPRALLERALGLFRHQAEQQSITLVLDESVDTTVATPDGVPVEPAQIWVDESRMLQVLGNLITNALRFTPGGGQVTLSARQSGTNMELLVSDNGVGIAAEDLPYVFNRFHRVDRSRHSETGETGLGLAIVKALVEAQGGSVAIESEPGTGTIVHLVFPINA
jgi:signal transduction histidine kinase